MAKRDANTNHVDSMIDLIIQKGFTSRDEVFRSDVFQLTVRRFSRVSMKERAIRIHRLRSQCRNKDTYAYRRLFDSKCWV